MKEMIRLKTTTFAGKVFLSPFVFHKKEALRRIEKPALEEPIGTTTEMLPVHIYSAASVWTKKKFGPEAIRVETLIEKITMAEQGWEVMELAYGKNT